LNFKNSTGLALDIKLLNSKMYIAIPRSDLSFQPKFWQPVTDYKLVEEYYVFFNSLVSLVNGLSDDKL